MPLSYFLRAGLVPGLGEETEVLLLASSLVLVLRRPGEGERSHAEAGRGFLQHNFVADSMGPVMGIAMHCEASIQYCADPIAFPSFVQTAPRCAAVVRTLASADCQ